jgi:hypothetical protein
MAFDPEVALAYARALSRPRRVGSDEEKRVAGEIAARLERFGYQVEREPFQFTLAFEIALAAEIALALALVLLALFVPARAFIFGSLLLALLPIALPLNRAIQYRAVAPDPSPGETASARPAWGLRLGRLYRTANIVAAPAPRRELDEGAPGRAVGLPHLYLVSHLDSKSQRLPILIRIFLFVVFLPAVALFALSAIAQSVSPNLQGSTLLLGAISLLSGLPLLLLDVQNESPGAIDNASGTGLLLHLAEVLAARPDLLSKIRLTVLVTSAEEMATIGALYHVKRHARSLREETPVVLNFDGIGVDGRLYMAGRGGALAARLHRAAAEQKIPLADFSLTGVLFDHLPFAAHGLDAATLLAIGGASRHVHTAGDSADKLNPRGFEMAGRVAMRVIEAMAAPVLSVPHCDLRDGGG